MTELRILVPDEKVPARTFERLAARHADLFSFDVAALLEPPAPWTWEWKTPLRAMQEAVIGDAGVTAWTRENAAQLSRWLAEESALENIQAFYGDGPVPLPDGVVPADRPPAEEASLLGVAYPELPEASAETAR